jgi:hypothetical protein
LLPCLRQTESAKAFSPILPRLFPVPESPNSKVKGDQGGDQGDAQKAPVKAGKEQEVQVLHMVMISDQPWPRVMRRPIVR